MIAVALYVYANISKSTTATLDPLLTKLDSYLSEKLILGPALSGLYLVNNGNLPLTLDYLVLQNTTSKTVTVVRADLNKLCSVSKPVLNPGDTSIITCSRNDLEAIAVVTSNGKVFVRDPKLAAPYLIPKTITQRVLLNPEIVVEVSQYMRAVSNLVNTSIMITKYIDMRNINLVLNANASLVIATKAPGNPNAWNILVVGYGGYGPRPGSILTIGGQSIDLSKVGYYRFRIKIENFTGEIKVDGVSGERVIAQPEIIPNVVNWGKQYFIHLSGSAGRISVYTNTSKLEPEPGSADLDPYYVFGDLDGNGYPEIIVVTQDCGTGNKSSVNDQLQVGGSSKPVVDSFSKPVRIAFTNAPVNNSKYATAIVSVRLFFWDSSEDDISDNDNRVILRVGVYDSQDNRSNRSVYSVSMSYYELCRYRTVKPFTISYIVKDFLLYIPPPEEIGLKDLYIVLEITDPYYLQGSRNDAEIIMGIEYVGLILGVRS